MEHGGPYCEEDRVMLVESAALKQEAAATCTETTELFFTFFIIGSYQHVGASH